MSIRRALSKFFPKSKGEGYWEVRRTIWPYPDGWGTYNPVTKTVLDTGLPTRARAQRICDQLNRRRKEKA